MNLNRLYTLVNAANEHKPMDPEDVLWVCRRFMSAREIIGDFLDRTRPEEIRLRSLREKALAWKEEE